MVALTPRREGKEANRCVTMHPYVLHQDVSPRLKIDPRSSDLETSVIVLVSDVNRSCQKTNNETPMDLSSYFQQFCN
jgi:hypothetical protein